jgi:CheY-like chemotaxis protein
MKAVSFETGRIGFKRILQKILFASVPQQTPTSCTTERTLSLGKRVLIVDDDAVVRLVTSRVLRSKGYEVVTAADCSAAIAAVGEGRPHAILLDLEFPPDIASGGGISWTGLHLMAWLRGLQNARGARFIIITNSSSEQSRERALAAGVVGFFQKPIDYECLVAAIDPELKHASGEVFPVPQVRLKI